MAEVEVTEVTTKRGGRVTIKDPIKYGRQQFAEALRYLGDAGLPPDLMEEGLRKASYLGSEEEIDKALMEEHATFLGKGIPGVFQHLAVVQFSDWLKLHLSGRQPLGDPVYKPTFVQLLALGSPAVTDSKMTCTTKDSGATNNGINVTVYGTGLGETRTRKITSTIVETCENGAAKSVVLEVAVRVQPMGLKLSTGQKISYMKAELAEPTSDHPWRRYVSWCNADDLAWLTGTSATPDEDRTDADGATFTDQGSMTGIRSMSIGIKPVNNVDLRLRADVEASTEYEVTTYLPGGHCYRRHNPSFGLGVIWEIVHAEHA